MAQILDTNGPVDFCYLYQILPKWVLFNCFDPSPHWLKSANLNNSLLFLWETTPTTKNLSKISPPFMSVQGNDCNYVSDVVGIYMFPLKKGRILQLWPPGGRGSAPHLSIAPGLEATLQQSHLLKVCLEQLCRRAIGSCQQRHMCFSSKGYTLFFTILERLCDSRVSAKLKPPSNIATAEAFRISVIICMAWRWQNHVHEEGLTFNHPSDGTLDQAMRQWGVQERDVWIQIEGP